MGRCEVTQQECLGHTIYCHCDGTDYDTMKNSECESYLAYKGEPTK